MKAQYRAVVIGGGVVGASVFYHLTKSGWSDVALIERAALTAGSTWHAAAGFHALNADPNIAALQDCAIRLYPEIEAESGQSCGLHMAGGVTFASDPDRWEWLRSAWAVFQAIGIETSRLVTPEEIAAINPLLDMTGIKGGLHDVAEGYLDPNGTTHADMTAAGARWGVSWGPEVPLYFAPSPDFTEPGTLKRSTAFPIIRDEALAVRDAAGLLDISGFAPYEVAGPGAEAWLDRLLACKLPGPGRARLAPMLAEDGRLKGDLTVFNWGDRRYWLMGSYYLRSFHLRWFADHAGEGANVRDISDDWVGFSVQGPPARAVIEQLAGPLSPLMMGCAQIDIGLTRARVARLSLSGELAFEINVPAALHTTLRRQLLDAGAGFGLREVGFAAMLSLRLEKSIGLWNAEYSQGYTPAMTGLDRWIDDKPGFIGREAFLSAPPPERRLMMLLIDADGADATGFEPVWQDRAKVGFTTSGGYGHRAGQSLALAQVRVDLAEPGTRLTVYVVGREQGAEVIALSPYDPKGERMRA